MTRSTAPSFSDDLSWLELPTMIRLRTTSPVEHRADWSLPRDDFTDVCVRVARDFPLPIARLALYDTPSCKDNEYSHSILLIDILRIRQYLMKDSTKLSQSDTFPWLAHSSVWLIDQEYRPYPSITHWLSHVITDRSEADAWISRAFESIGGSAKDSFVRIIPFEEEGGSSSLLTDTGMYPATHRRVFGVESHAYPSFVPRDASKYPVPKNAPISNALCLLFCTVNQLVGDPIADAKIGQTASVLSSAEADLDTDVEEEEEEEEEEGDDSVARSKETVANTTAHVTSEISAATASPSSPSPDITEILVDPVPLSSERPVRQATVRHRDISKKRARESSIIKTSSGTGGAPEPSPVKHPKKRTKRRDHDEEDGNLDEFADSMSSIDLEVLNENLQLEIGTKDAMIASLERKIKVKDEHIAKYKQHLSRYTEISKRFVVLGEQLKTKSSQLDETNNKLEHAIEKRAQLETEKRELAEKIVELEKIRPPPVGMIEENVYDELMKAHEEAIAGHEKRVNELLAKHESERNESKQQTDLLERSIAAERERWSALKADCTRLVQSLPERRFETSMTGEAHMFISALIRELTTCVGTLDKDMASRDRRISELELEQQRCRASIAADAEQLETSRTLREQDARTIEELRGQFASATNRLAEVERELETLRTQQCSSAQKDEDVCALLLCLSSTQQRLDAYRKTIMSRHYPDRDFTYLDPSLPVMEMTLATGNANTPNENHPNVFDGGDSHGMASSSSTAPHPMESTYMPTGTGSYVNTVNPAMLHIPNAQTSTQTSASFLFTGHAEEFDHVAETLVRQARNFEEATTALTANADANSVMRTGPPTSIFIMSPVGPEYDTYAHTPPSTPKAQSQQQQYPPPPQQQSYQSSTVPPPPLPISVNLNVQPSVQMPSRELIGRIDEQSREAARPKPAPDMFVDESLSDHHQKHPHKSSRKKSGRYEHGGSARRNAAVIVSQARSKSGGPGRKPKHDLRTMSSYNPQTGNFDADATIDDNLLASRMFSTSRT